MEEIDPSLRNGINFVFVRDISQAFRHVFAKDGTAKKRTQK